MFIVIASTNIKSDGTVIGSTMQKLFRMSQISSTPAKSGLLPVSRATLWRWVSEGKFPKPFKMGARTTVWDAVEVLAYINAQKAGRK
jgi:predicted DNA-binding transcriptional regulator AlpA